MNEKFLEIKEFAQKHLSIALGEQEDTGCFVFRVSEGLKPIQASHLNFYLVVLCVKGEARIRVGHHDFTIRTSSISIVPPHTLCAAHILSEDFDAYFLLFKSDFVKQGFVKSEVMEELLSIHPDYPPIFDLQESDLNDTLYKVKKIKQEMDVRSAFHLEIARLYILQILYDYNRVCEMCLLNSDKFINRKYQVTYQFRKLVETNFHLYKTVNAYADLMHLSSKYISECVKHHTGASALALIQHRIVLEAELLLKYSPLSIKGISNKLGFSSVSTFSRFFKGVKGISPNHYQNKLEN